MSGFGYAPDAWSLTGDLRAGRRCEQSLGRAPAAAVGIELADEIALNVALRKTA